jgi:hypothetical protein
MPTVLRTGPYRFYFYSSDGDEPPHVHVARDDATAKFWLDPVRYDCSVSFKARELRRIRSIIARQRTTFCRHGMSTSASESTRRVAVDVGVTEETLTVRLDDGRALSVPLAWYPRLADGTPLERARWELTGSGHGIRWPDLDEDISVEALLAGRRSNESPSSLAKWRSTRRPGV